MAAAIIEIGRDGQTVPVFCPINGQTLRAKHSIRNLQNEGLQPLQAIAIISGHPGHHVALDVKAKSCKVYWPIRPGTREYDDFKAKAVKAGEPGLERAFEDEYNDLTDEGVAEWAFWMKRLVDNGDAEVVSGGPVPDMIPKAVTKQRRIDEILSDPMVAAGLMHLDNPNPAIAKT